MNPGNLGSLKNKPTELNASTVLMVSNISRNVTKKHLQEIFSPYGELKGVYVPRHEETKSQKPYIFLEYGNQENAEKAMIYFSGGQIDGLVVKVEILNPDNLINNTINNTISQQTNLKNKTKEEIYHNRNYNSFPYKEREKEKDNLTSLNVEGDIEEGKKHMEETTNLENFQNSEGKKLQGENSNKLNVKKMKSRSRSRRRSRSNSNPRYRRDYYKNSHNYNNYGYRGSRRYQDFNDRNRKRYKRKDSRSSGKSSERSSSRSSRSSS
jgi:RNA recognition motif-containing protein